MAEKNVLAQLTILDPWLLLTIARGSSDFDRAVRGQVSVEKRIFKVSLLALLDQSLPISNFSNLLVWQVDHLSDHCVEQA